jgi:predicted TIM-barrel fold metal-dependent hydrolase
MSPPAIFDAHAHLLPGPGRVAQLLESMHTHGIGRTVVVAGAVPKGEDVSRLAIEGGGVGADPYNDVVLDACEESDGRLIPFFFGNPHREAKTYQEAAHRVRGLKLGPAVHGVALDDPRHVPFIQVARDFGHPVYLHCLERPGFRVLELIDLAERFPDVTFILGHGGVGDMDLYGVSLIRPYANISFETSGGYLCVLRAALAQLGPERVIFGSEYPFQHPHLELEKYRLLNLPRAVWEDVSWNNISRLIGMSA